MLTGRKDFVALHLAWAVGCLVALAGAGVWYGFSTEPGRRWPGGGSEVGLSLGVVAGLIILFEFALWPRKSPLFRTSRWLGKSQLWMKAHIWLGLLALPLALMHCGFEFGGTYTWLLMLLLLAVTASGIFGLAMQNLLPRLLLDAVPDETVASQASEIARQYAEDARRIVLSCCEEAEALLTTNSRSAGNAAAETASDKPLIGVRRQVGTIVAPSLDPELDRPQRTNAPGLVRALADDIEPFLRKGMSEQGRLGTRRENERYFDELRRQSPAGVRSAIDELELLCDRRGQLSLQERIQFWLHAWLIVHLPLSVALVALLAGHVCFALRTG